MRVWGRAIFCFHRLNGSMAVVVILGLVILLYGLPSRTSA